MVTENFGGDPRFDSLYLRGFNLENDKFLDGLRLMRSTQYPTSAPSFELYGIERVEVLKGPASLLYGAGTPAGLVNFVQKRAQADGDFTELGFSLDSKGSWAVYGDANRVVDDRFAYRITAKASDTNSDVEEIDNERGYLGISASYALGDMTELEVMVSYHSDAPHSPTALTSHALRADLAPARLLLAGLAIGALASAVLGAIMASDDRRAWVILGWLAGSTAHVTPAGAAALAALALALLAGLLAAARWLEILPLGPAVGRALGLPMLSLRLGLILTAGLATGAATLLVGPVSFVGLMAPHVARGLGLVRAAPFVAGSWLIGALLMVLAAFGARTLAFPYDLPLGLVATLIGAPWLFVTLMKRTAP